MERFIITIERGFGSKGKKIGKGLAKELGVEFFEDSIAKRASEASGINMEMFLKMERTPRKGVSKKLDRIYNGEISDNGTSMTDSANLYNYEAKVLRDYAAHDSMIVMGLTGNMIFRDYPNALRLNIQTTDDAAVAEVMESYGEGKEEALRMIRGKNQFRSDFYKYFTGESWHDGRFYDFMINTSNMTVDQCIRLIKMLLEEKMNR